MPSAPNNPSRQGPMDLSEVMCDVTVRRPLFGTGGDSPLPNALFSMASVRATASHVHQDVASGVVGVRQIGFVDGAVVDLNIEEGDFPLELVEAHPVAGWIARELFTDPTIYAELDDGVLGPEPFTQLVLVNNIVIEKAYRGQKLGPRLLTTLVETVAGHDHSTLVALSTEPNPHELDGADPLMAQVKISAAFEAAGYSHFRDGIFWQHTAFVGPERLNE